LIPALDLTAATALDADPIRIHDIPGHLRALNPAGEYMAVRAGDDAMDRLLYTTLPENTDGFHNHFQGIQRLYDGRHIVISGSNWHDPPRGSEIYVAEVGSAPASGPWLSNVAHGAEPATDDRMISGITVDGNLWHGGGMDVLGPVLAIPAEFNDRPWIERTLVGSGRPTRSDASAVCFFDMTNPAAPRFFRGADERIVRPGFKAGAAALTRLPNGHYLCGVWSDSDQGPMRLDLYLSETPLFDGRFRQSPDAVRTWTPDASDPDRRAFMFQAVNFLHDTDGRLYLVGFCTEKETHCIELYTVDIPNAHRAPAAGAGIDMPTVTRVRPRITFRCGHKHCDMRGASGAFVAEDQVLVYSAAQYRGNKAGDFVRFCEFRRPLAAVQGVTTASAWVELYEGPHLEGATLTLRDLAARGTLENYKRVRVGGRHFGDRARSARYQLPVGAKYTLYRHHGFKDPIIELRGTGRVEHEPDFGALGVGEEVSSSMLEADG
jgi:hypothetical protein